MEILISKMENPLYFRFQPLTPQHYSTSNQDKFNKYALPQLEKMIGVKETAEVLGGKLVIIFDKDYSIEDKKVEMENALIEAFPFIDIKFTYKDRTKK